MNTKHQLLSTSLFIFFSLTFVNGQSSQGQPFTASYDVAVKASHITEKDQAGGILQAINFVPGTGEHSILGEVTSLSIVRVDLSTGENVIEFIETDKDGNSLYASTKGITIDATTWECHGAIMGGTGKYKTATGYFKAIGTSIDTASSWTSEGMLYYVDVEAEKTAIKDVINNETKTFYKQDFDAWSQTIVHADYVEGIFTTEPGVVDRYTSYNTMKSAFEGFSGFPTEQPIVKRTNWNIQVRGQVAWATFNQETTTDGSVQHSIESRILERSNGSWRIAHNTVSYDYSE